MCVPGPRGPQRDFQLRALRWKSDHRSAQRPEGNHVTEARFVHIVDEVPELGGRSDGPVLVTALEGFLDAGNASALTTQHLTSSDEGRVVAVFDVDEFYDYRARRPPLTFVEDHYADYEAP